MHAPISFSIVKKLRSYNEIANLTTLKPEESSVTISYAPPPPPSKVAQVQECNQ